MVEQKLFGMFIRTHVVSTNVGQKNVVWSNVGQTNVVYLNVV
jgi:hypothetical protein